MSGSPTNSTRPEDDWLRDAAIARESKHLTRALTEYPSCGATIEVNGHPCLNFASNDSLALSQHPTVIARAHDALATYGAGSTASRLVTGTLPIHSELERKLATLKHQEDALVFGSGYMANAGIIPALVSRNDTIFADRLCHASILDAITLSRATLVRYHHNDVNDLDKRLSATTANGRRLIITESIFSMDGDAAPLSEIATLAKQHACMLMIDEAHATGIFGAKGSGLVQIDHQATLTMGTLSKALGGYGGFVACSTLMKQHLINTARSFIYTTAPPPSVVGAALGALDVLQSTPELGSSLLQRAKHFRDTLQHAGLDTGLSESHIIPIIVGDSDAATRFSKRLLDDGILTIAIRPPTVPTKSARIRLSTTLHHSEQQLTDAAARIIAAATQEGLI